jgi:hypothetical protein
MSKETHTILFFILEGFAFFAFSQRKLFVPQFGMNGKYDPVEKLIESSISRPVRPKLFVQKPIHVCTRPIPPSLSQKVAEPESKIATPAESKIVKPSAIPEKVPTQSARFLGLKQVPEKRKRAAPLKPRAPKKVAALAAKPANKISDNARRIIAFDGASGVISDNGKTHYRIDNAGGIISDDLKAVSDIEDEKSDHSDQTDSEPEEKIQACQDKFAFTNNNANLAVFSEEPLPDIIPVPTHRSLRDLVAAQSINCHTDTTSRIREFVTKNRKMSDQPILLVTGPNGSGKTWCVDHVLKELHCHKVALDDLCDPSNITTTIRAALLWRMDNRQCVVVLDDVEGLSKKPFMNDFVDILTGMLMPLKNAKRKEVASTRLLPNAVIVISASKYDKNVTKLTNVFGLANPKKTTKYIDKMMHAVCKPLGRTNIAGLVRETFGPCDLEKFTKVSVDCNYVFAQIEFDALLLDTRKSETIDASSNVDMFAVGQSLLGGRKATSIERVEQQWEKAGHLFPGMIQNSFPDFVSSVETYSEICDLYSDKDLVFDNHAIDSTWNSESAFEFRENYECVLQYGIQLALQHDPADPPSGRKELRMFASKTKETVKHSRIPPARFEIYSAMADISRTEQTKRLTTDLSYKPQEQYKLSEIDFCADMMNMKYLEKLEDTKKSKKTVPISADLVKRLSYAFQVAEE